ncbi:hypothetical protein BDZ91DRAFT_141261 [Kalaharituber pfeilii]|nr:hypothetical protein BDZ91DRAFT_141261 [Kalaharituber pfeilii]
MQKRKGKGSGCPLPILMLTLNNSHSCHAISQTNLECIPLPAVFPRPRPLASHCCMAASPLCAKVRCAPHFNPLNSTTNSLAGV